MKKMVRYEVHILLYKSKNFRKYKTLVNFLSQLPHWQQPILILGWKNHLAYVGQIRFGKKEISVIF